MQKLQAIFETKTEQFCELVGMTRDQVEALSESDRPEDFELHIMYINFLRGIWPNTED